MSRNVLALLTLALGFAAAQGSSDTYVPNTSVSYRLVNASRVFIDSNEDGENYVEFRCSKGAPVFYLSTVKNILSQADYDAQKTPDLTYLVDNQAAKTLKTTVTQQSADPEDESHLSTLAVNDKDDPVIFNVFKNAASKVVLKFTRSDGKAMTLTA